MDQPTGTPLTLSEKIIKNHLVKGEMSPGKEITLKIDQCLLQDATGTMAWLEFEAIGVPKVKNNLVVQYIDHNLMQQDNKNMDDHFFLMSIGSKFGAKVSLPGNGVCHHVHKERFTQPGQIVIGTDSHTPTSGGSGMIAIGVGGMDIAVAMATEQYTLIMPKIVGVNLTGKLQEWCNAKDVILELLRQVNVDGGKGKIFEFFGEGVKSLDVSERSSITNMGAETGATTSIFPSDELTKQFFEKEKRVEDYQPLQADAGATYAEIITINLDTLEPLIACPSSPGNVKKVREVAGIEVNQAIVGSCSNSSYQDIMRCASMVKQLGKHNWTSYHIVPGSKQVLESVERDEGLRTLLSTGARISEPSCNACIGMGNAPATGIVSVRSSPRNWKGRSGTQNDQVFLASPEVVTASAITGELTDPRDLGIPFPVIKEPNEFVVDDKMILEPTFEDKIKRGPNIKPLTYRTEIEDSIQAEVSIKLDDDISTDHIMPAGSQVLPLRSNIPAISEFVFHHVDKEYVNRSKEKKEQGGSIIVGGDNYGQGSSREHAAIAPMFLGVKAVITKSMARIHRSNLINWGILPLIFENKEDHGLINQGDELELVQVNEAILGDGKIIVKNKTNETEIPCTMELRPREQEILSKGGLLNYVKEQVGNEQATTGGTPMNQQASLQQQTQETTQGNTHNVTLITGDGVGPELAQAMKKCVDATGVKINWDEQTAGIEVFEAEGDPLPPRVIESIKRNKVAIKAPITTPVGKGFRSVNVRLRKVLDLYQNVRPAKTYQGVNSRYDNINIVSFRENTDDVYVGVEFEQGHPNTIDLINTIKEKNPDGAVIREDSGLSIKPISIMKSERIVRAAMEFARKHKRKKVTAVHKANIMKHTDGLFLDVARKVAAEYPDVEFEDRIVDNMCMQLVQKPELYDVLVLPNLYGDVVSDLCAGLVGGLGVAPGANIGEHYAVFEAVHGSAPKYAGLNKVNPSALILTSVMMLRHLGEGTAADKLEQALSSVIAEGTNVTYDLMPDRTGGVGTQEMADAVIAKMNE